MKRLKHKTVACTFLLALWAPVFLLGYLKVEQQFTRLMMELRMEHDHLETITMPLQDLRWHQKGKELWIENRLFDVKSHRIAGDQVEITGIFDDEETAIKENLNRLEEQQQGDNKQTRALLNRLRSLVLFDEAPDNNWIFPPAPAHLTTPPQFQARLANPFLSVIAPPPKA